LNDQSAVGSDQTWQERERHSNFSMPKEEHQANFTLTNINFEKWKIISNHHNICHQCH